MATTSFSETSAGGQAANPACAAYVSACMDLRVLPLVPGTKQAALKGWPELATTSLAQIQYWFCGEYQDYGVGVATGPGSGVWVLDVDVKHGINGFESLRDLCSEFGADPRDMAGTFTVASPSGGVHLYFSWTPEVDADGGIKSKSGVPAPGLDTRGHGGYVHAAGWNSYAVVPRNGVRHIDILPAPSWLVQVVKERQKTVRHLGGESENQPGEPMHVMGTRRTLITLGSTPSGSRNHELNRAAYRLSIRGELTHDEAWKACQAQLISMGAGDGMESWRRTFESGWNAGLRHREQG